MRIYRYGRVESTQDVAKELIRKGGIGRRAVRSSRSMNGEGGGGGEGAAGLVVVADEQMKGKGRLDREWISPAGGLYLSAVFESREGISLLAGVAVAKSLREIGIDAKIKWPNDIVVTEKKIAGILVEIFEDYAVVGIGVNMSGAPLPTATSVREQGMSISKDELLERIIKNFGTEDIFDDYRRMSATIGRHVRVEMVNSSVEGVARDIDEHGRLILECSGEIKKIASGDCIHLR